MSDEYPKLGHPTSKLARAHAEMRQNQDDIVTKVKCPVCLGCGMVPPEVAVLADQALSMMKDDS